MVEFGEYFLYLLDISTLLDFVVCKYFLPVFSLPFNPLNRVLEQNVNEVQFIKFFSVFGIMSGMCSLYDNFLICTFRVCAFLFIYIFL